MTLFTPVGKVIKSSWCIMLAWGLLFAVAAQVLQLFLLVVRFGELPNYFIHYDWIESLRVIANSTPSFKDMFPIMFEQWWIEIGFMNYDYGNGISEWSLNVIPSRLVMLTMMGGMLVILVQLHRGMSCRNAPAVKTRAVSVAGASLGMTLMCMTSAAMSWVVCCATPSWVVGLAMLGLGVSTSLALESLGPTLFYSGFALLSLSILLLARQQVQSQLQEKQLIPDQTQHQTQTHVGDVHRGSISERELPLPLTRN